MAIIEELPAPPERRRAMFQITEVMLARFLENGEHHYSIADGLPDGARILGSQYDLPTGSWLVVVEHESFQNVRECDVLPKIWPTITYLDGPIRDGWMLGEATA